MSHDPQGHPVPRYLLLKLLLVHIVMFIIFYSTGMWAIKDM